MDHWEAKRYPLAVKLGTITPDGADVYSYDEDEMVEDPGLPKHLAHFGINIAFMTKVRGRSTGDREQARTHSQSAYLVSIPTYLLLVLPDLLDLLDLP